MLCSSVQIKHHLKLFFLISGKSNLSSQWVLSFLFMGRGDKGHLYCCFVSSRDEPESLVFLSSFFKTLPCFHVSPTRTLKLRVFMEEANT